MKIRTNVKAGEQCDYITCGRNHNEKLADDNSNSIEQKKRIGKKLRLSKETIRELKDSDLKRIAGGISGIICTQTCYYTTCGEACG
jgi:natural product precursor